MAIQNLCPPALVYLVFSIVQIVIDIGQGYYNTAFAKVIVATIFAILLNYLCMLGLGIISWVIVFLPFIFMSVIISVLLYVLGLKPTSGKLKVYRNNNQDKPTDEEIVESEKTKEDVTVEQDPNENIFNKTNDIIQKQKKTIKEYEEQLKNMKVTPGSNIVQSHHHHDTHSHEHENGEDDLNNNGINQINNTIDKNNKIKKNNQELKPKNMKNKKKCNTSLNIDYEQDISFTKMSDSEVNKSIDTMLEELKKTYN
jgi:hypothetical protein